MNLDEGLRYSFEEVWRYLNSHGSGYINLESGKQVIARTGFTKKDNVVKKIIRFQFEENEIRVSNSCWDQGMNCDEDWLPGLRDKLANYIENTQWC